MEEKKHKEERQDRQLRLLLLLVLSLSVVALAFGNPYSGTWPLKCPLHMITGLQCPFCGAQRMAHELLRLRFFEAWRLNAGLLLSLPYFLVLLIGALFPAAAESRVVRWCQRDFTVFAVMFYFVVWGILRNVI